MYTHSTTNNAIDQIVYGDILIDDKLKISCSDPIIGYFFATGLIYKFFDLKPPPNSSQETINELLFLERVTKNASQEDIIFATKAETMEKDCYVQFCKEVLNQNININFFDKIFNQTDPILMFLKRHFNRPRPYQLAPYYNIQLKFSVPNDPFHPAYPSGHAFDAFIVEHILSKFFPNKKIEINKFCNDMAYSRYIAGVHYPSDNKISKILADTIIKHNLIKL